MSSVGAKGGFGGFIGAGTYLASVLMNSPEPTAEPSTTGTPEAALPAAAATADVLEAAALQVGQSGISEADYRSPFAQALHIAIRPVKLEQTAAYLQSVAQLSSIHIHDAVKSEIHWFIAGSIGLLATCAQALVDACVEDTVVEVNPEVKRDHVIHRLREENGMIRQIIQVISNPKKLPAAQKLLMLEALRSDGPLPAPDFESEGTYDQLRHYGILTEEGACRLSSPFLHELLLEIIYPEKTMVLDSLPRRYGALDTFELLCVGIKHISSKIMTGPFSLNVRSPSEACFQAELYSALRSLGIKSTEFTAHVEVKQSEDTASGKRLDLMLRSRDRNIAGYELKVGILRRQDIVGFVRDRAERYRRQHNIGDMYLVNLVGSAHVLEADVPGRCGEVECVYVRHDDAFRNLRIIAPGLGADRLVVLED
ncbi:hypothetical protein HK097_001558 [Rhizophlyctis rosea]|uniref:Uncharacterized protein n=1 Tax=Rhizophlyctis rosea TaxID=64517 RepID=A0AAD5S6M4_9FUNG|nr:hypothetical protein HK097_001558 [Rhizophlyctis rosea]